MSGSSSHQVTGLLQAWCEGKEDALEELVPLVYQELHSAATRYMARENPGHTLQTTALVNEVYLRLVDVRGIPWQNRAHFFAVCAKLMRRILTDFARSRQSLKRGGDVPHLPWEEADRPAGSSSSRLLSLDTLVQIRFSVHKRKKAEHLVA